jgi:maltooligosyltrehalose synthase
MLKLTCPGVPDIFQGTEMWDFSLVDPDNRRPVDYAMRRCALDEDERSEAVESLMASWRDGRIKQAVIHRVLALRRQAPELFALGVYEPIEVTGPRRNHAIAFMRRYKRQTLIVVAPRLPSTMIGETDVPLPGGWGDTVLMLDGIEMTFEDRMSGAVIDLKSGERLKISRVLQSLPVALLWRDGTRG